MAHWGVAMTLFQPLWPTRPTSAQDCCEGWDEVQKAKERSSSTRARAALRCRGRGILCRAGRRATTGRAFAAGRPRWASSTAAFPAMRKRPRSTRLRTSRPRTPATAREMRIGRPRSCYECYAQNPDHPGAMHYLIHANDVPGRERESLEVTHKYERGRAAQPARAAHADAYLYAPGRLGRRHLAATCRQPRRRWSIPRASTANWYGTSFRTRSNISCMRTCRKE